MGDRLGTLDAVGFLPFSFSFQDFFSRFLASFLIHFARLPEYLPKKWLENLVKTRDKILRNNETNSMKWKTQAKKLSLANSIQCSQAVTHPSTDWTQHCLTSVIGRELVCSMWYGRWHLRAQNGLIFNLSLIFYLMEHLSRLFTPTERFKRFSRLIREGAGVHF